MEAAAAKVEMPKAKNAWGWVIGLASVGAIAFVIGWSLKKGQKVAS